jgi:hypothetical protein
VFQRFSSMVPILHVQIIYNVHKPLTTISMIFVYFTSFLALEAAKPTKSVCSKPGKIGQFIGFSSSFLIQFKISTDLNSVPIFDRFYRFLVKLTKLVRCGFWGSADFLNPAWIMLQRCSAPENSFQAELGWPS